MTRETRSRRPAVSGDRPGPLYARALRLRHINPGGMLCFLFFEGMVALAILLALAEQVSWWAVPVLPAAVAAMVKVNDVVAGALVRSGRAVRPRRATDGEPVRPAGTHPVRHAASRRCA